VVCLRHGEKLRRICSALKGYAIHGDRSACSPAWHVPQRGMFLSVACSSAWHVPQRGMLPNVVSSSPVRCGVVACVCVRSEDVKRIGHGVEGHIFGKVGDECVVLPGYPESAECE